jgi:hypothetical protein
MKGSVTIVLMLLIGGYGAAQAQAKTVTEEETKAAVKQAEDAAAKLAAPEETIKTEEATTDFLGLKWGLGIGVIGGFGGDRAVEKASIINGVVRVEEEGNLRPQSFLEMHVFLDRKARDWRWYQQGKAAAQMAKSRGVTRKPTEEGKKLTTPTWPTMPDPPLWGFGPFIALQSSDKKVIDALSLGVMWGLRKDPQSSVSLNVGIGLSFDPSVQVLGGGLKDGQKTAETEVRFKKEGRFGWALMASFTF